jgi:glutamine amidotransferase
MLGIVDYGVGNLFSLECSLKKIGVECAVSSDKNFLSGCDRVILPGVGAFGDAAEKLNKSGLKDTILNIAKSGTPLLGICLGMQLLFDKSYEFGEHSGLGLISGEVRYMGEVVKGLKIPHIGWNSLNFKRESKLFKYVNEGDYVYFVHSYHAVNCDKNLVATAYYGGNICAAVESGNVYGVQFHPEKSGDVGLSILKAFSKL